MPPPHLLVALAALSVLAVLAVLGQGQWSGPTLWSLTDRHGLHVRDLGVLLLWATGAVTAIRLAGRR